MSIVSDVIFDYTKSTCSSLGNTFCRYTIVAGTPLVAARGCRLSSRDFCEFF